MSKHEKWTCMICEKNSVNVTIASNGDHTDFGFGPNRPVCKETKCRDEMKERMKEHYKRKVEEQVEKILIEIQEIMRRKEKIYVDFENYALTEQQKEICRKYVRSY